MIKFILNILFILDLNEIKAQLETTITDEDLKNKLERVISTTRSRSGSQSSQHIADLSRQTSTISDSGSLRRRTSELKKSESPQKIGNGTNQKLIETEKSETGSVKWDVYKHYLKSIGWTLSIATVILNMIFQSFSIGSNIWLSEWANDKNAGNDSSVRNKYLYVYGGFGVGQGESIFNVFFY